MFSFDYIVLFIGFSLSLLVLGITWTRRNVVYRSFFFNYLILNGLYAIYILILLVLNYIKFYQSHENAFWQTTEIWCFGIANISMLAWRLPFLIASYFKKRLSNSVKKLLLSGFILSLVWITAGFLFFRQQPLFAVLTTAVPILFFLFSTTWTIILIFRKDYIEDTILNKLLIAIPIVLLLLSVFNDATIHVDSIPTLYPFTMVLFQISMLINMQERRNGAGTPDIKFFLAAMTDFYQTSDRENELISLLLKGLSKNEIANRLFISPNTVKTHVSNIYRKMKISSRNELFYKYYREIGSETPDN